MCTLSHSASPIEPLCIKAKCFKALLQLKKKSLHLNTAAVVTLYNNVHDELKRLKEKHSLILLTDNWPCVISYLKKYELYDFFEKVYISSIYGAVKNDKVLFDYPINDFNIKPGEALFIDDNEANLDIAIEKGFDVLLMDREKNIKESKYKIINNLNNIE